jgi:hypothetical protein
MPSTRAMMWQGTMVRQWGVENLMGRTEGKVRGTVDNHSVVEMPWMDFW